ncbi:MAG: RDD family protein [Kineosporiaceae bacterium]
MSEAPPPPPSDPTGPTQPSGSVPPPPPPAAPGAPPAGHGAPPAPGYGAPAGALADWPLRAYSGLIDWFGPGLVAGVIYQGSNGLGSLLYLAALAWAIYNAYLGGQTGQSFGKKIAGTRLVVEATGQPPGGGLGIGRYFLHILDALPCYLGFLWPLWDAKRQTFADKILKTNVVKV